MLEVTFITLQSYLNYITLNQSFTNQVFRDHLNKDIISIKLSKQKKFKIRNEKIDYLFVYSIMQDLNKPNTL